MEKFGWRNYRYILDRLDWRNYSYEVEKFTGQTSDANRN